MLINADKLCSLLMVGLPVLTARFTFFFLTFPIRGVVGDTLMVMVESEVEVEVEVNPTKKYLVLICGIDPWDNQYFAALPCRFVKQPLWHFGVLAKQSGFHIDGF